MDNSPFILQLITTLYALTAASPSTALILAEMLKCVRLTPVVEALQLSSAAFESHETNGSIAHLQNADDSRSSIYNVAIRLFKRQLPKVKCFLRMLYTCYEWQSKTDMNISAISEDITFIFACSCSCLFVRVSLITTGLLSLLRDPLAFQ